MMTRVVSSPNASLTKSVVPKTWSFTCGMILRVVYVAKYAYLCGGFARGWEGVHNVVHQVKVV